MVNGGLLLLLGLAAIGWWGSTLAYADVVRHLNANAPDGEVETYTRLFHGNVQANLRTLVGVCGTLAVALLFYRLRMKRMVPVPNRVLGSMRADVARAWYDLLKHTSPAHGRMVLFVVLVGAVLRAVLLWQPITYDEAFTYTYYASRPVHVIVSDYSYPNNHILHTLLVKLFTTVFGVGLVSLRLTAYLAGVLALPVFYLLVRSLFNRYIALLALALASASGPLLDYSACARGYSLTWFFMLLALLLGRYGTKQVRPSVALLLGLCCALGMWTIPSFAYIAGMVYVWLLITALGKGEEHMRAHVWNWVLSAMAFVACTALFYLPVILVHGMDQVTAHDTYGVPDRAVFARTYTDRALELWAVLADSSAWWVAALGFIALVYSGYTSSRYRALLAALVLGAVPLVVLQALVAPPRVWLYSVFIFHMGSAIALYYLLKAVQERLLKKAGKRQRTAVAALLLLVAFGWPGLRVERLGQGGMPEAEWCARKAVKLLRPGDKLYTQYPWDSPIEFHLLAMGGDRDLMYGPYTPGNTLLVAVGPDYDQTLQGVLAHQNVPAGAHPPFRLIQDSPRLKIFAAP